MHNFRKLEVWHESVDLAVDVYKLTEAFPREERFGLSAQMRSAAVSLSSNIAEGAGRAGSKELARFLRIALGSLSEIDSQLELAVRLGHSEAQPELTESIRVLGKRLLRFHDRIVGVR